MGSLSSRPKVPQVQQPLVVTLPSNSYTPPTPDVTDTGSGGSSGAGDSGTDTGTGAAADREDNLLNRSRGRLSTVLTGFRGLLSQPVEPSGRKSLLGE